jgi:hypothetical protein
VSIAALVRAGPGTRVVLADHAAFAWEGACIFGPYTSGKNTAAYVDEIKSLFEPNMEPGMRRIAHMMEHANASAGTTE